MDIFSGSSNPNLAAQIAKTASSHMGEVSISRFQNDECRIHIPGSAAEHSALVQSFSIPVHHHIIEFCLIADALRRVGVSHLTAVIPWLGYSKQDKVFRPGEPLSIKVIANIVQTAALKKVITVDLHNPAIAGFFDIPLVNISAAPLFIHHFTKAGVNADNTIVVSPDAGAVKASTAVAHQLGLPIAYINKQRDLQTGEVSIVDIDKPVKGKHTLIFDDMVATGSTLLETAKYLKTVGAKSTQVAITHHLYLPGVQAKIDASSIDHIVTTNTVTPPKTVKSKKLTILSIAPQLATALG